MFVFMLFAVLLLGGCAKCDYETHDNLVARWNRPPTIEICHDVPVEPEFIMDQFDWWHDEVSEEYVYENYFYSDCSEPVSKWTIRLQHGDEERMDEKNFLGTAKRTYANIFKSPYIIRHVVINLREGNPEGVIRHEIGHAFGWNHFEDPDHLMYETYNTVQLTCDLDDYPPMQRRLEDPELNDTADTGFFTESEPQA